MAAAATKLLTAEVRDVRMHPVERTMYRLLDKGNGP